MINLTQPSFTPPPLACDAHCHVFGPAVQFPYSAERKYTPVDAPKENLFALHEQLGFQRAVLVQASCHGTDNRAMVDMLHSSNGQYRGVAVIDESTTKAELTELHHAGVRGIRFNFLTRLVDLKPRAVYLRLAKMIADLNWHVVVYFESENLKNIIDLLKALPTPIVVDHMGRPDISQSVESAEFQSICSLIADNPKNWIKVSCIERLTKAGAPYNDVLPFAKYLVGQFPNQVLWGTDWPHPNMEPNIPNDSLLVNCIPLMATTPELQNKLLVGNPHRLYDFESRCN